MGPNLDLCCRRWHPAKLGGAPYRQLCPAYPSADHSHTLFRRSRSPRDRAKGSAGTFQRGKFPALTPLHQKRISQKLDRKFPHTSTGTHGTQQAWINSRNLTNIATGWKHRQPIFLHPTVGTGAVRLGRPPFDAGVSDCHPERDIFSLARNLSKPREMLQLAPRKRKQPKGSLRHNNRALGSLSLHQRRRASLLNPSPFSTLKVFHSNEAVRLL